MSGQDPQEHSFVKVLYDFQYKTAEGREIIIKKNEKLYLLQKTNVDWWQVFRTWEQKSFYVPVTYVREMFKPSKKSSEEDKDVAPEAVNGPKYKNMPKETSTAIKNVRKWLTSAAVNSEHDSFRAHNSDESHKHNAMDYAAREELKVGLAAIKSKSLERDHDQLSPKGHVQRKKKVSDRESSKMNKYFSTSPKSFDTCTKMGMPLQDPFKKELESSLDRLRRKSGSINHDKLMNETREQKMRKKFSHSDDSYIGSDVEDQFLPFSDVKLAKIDETEPKLSLSLYTESSSGLNSNNGVSRISRSLDNNVKHLGKRTERSLSPRPAHGQQLTILNGEKSDAELNSNEDYKILNDKRRTWAVEELMTELTQMCKERNCNRKLHLQLESVETKQTFNPLDELTKELHEMNLIRSCDNTPQIESQSIDAESNSASPSNVCKILIQSGKKASELNSQSIKQNEEAEDTTEYSNISGTFNFVENTPTYRHSKTEKASAFTFHSSDTAISHSKCTKSPKILDEYNEANILNDCISNGSSSDLKSSYDKESRYHKNPYKEIIHSSPINNHELPSYSSVKMYKTNTVRMRSKTSISPGELKLTPSLEKLAREIQFLPVNRSSHTYQDITSVSNEFTNDDDICNDSGIHNSNHEYSDTWSSKSFPTSVSYADSSKAKRKGQFFHRGNSDLESNDEDYEKSMTNVKICSIKKSATLHCITIPENYQRFRVSNDLASIRSKFLKRQSRSLSDLQFLEENVGAKKHNMLESNGAKPVPSPRKKLPVMDLGNVQTDDIFNAKINEVNQIPVPALRKICKKKREISMDNDVWEKINKYENQPMNQIMPNIEINIESSTAIGFKTLLCTSDSGSDNCLQSKDLLSHNSDEFNNIDTTNQIQGKQSSSMAILKTDMMRRKESSSEEQILSSNASSEALRSQSELEVTTAIDASSLPSPINVQSGYRDKYQCAIKLPPGWIQKYDLQTDKIYFVNKQGDRWLSSNDEEGKIYFFEENSNESSWVLPTILPDETQLESLKHEDAYPQIEKCSSITSSNTSSINQSTIKCDVLTKKLATHPNDWPQLSFDGNMRILKESSLSRTKITENGKKLRKNWNTSYAVLTELFLLFFKDSKTFSTMMKSGHSPIAKPDISVDLNGALIESGETASSRKNVYRISTVLGLQVLIQSDNAALAMEWFQEIYSTICKLPSSFKFKTKFIANSTEVRKINTAKLRTEVHESEDSKKVSKVARSRSMKTKRLDDSLEDLSGTVAERQTKIKAKLRRFFLRRPTVESLVKNGIYKDEPAFGSYLKDVCPPDHPRIPLFVKTCIEVLENDENNMKTDGLYRASGNLSQIQKIRFQVDQYNLKVLSQEEDVHVLTGALKLFFRELKEPLIPSSFFEEALNTSMLKKTSAKIQKFREIIKALPPSNHDTLQFLLKHLLKVTSYQEFNRMHIPNLAIVFGPTLMWPAEESANMALDLMQQNLVIECLLSEYNEIFK